jgi:lambda family phage portal protein
MSTHWLDRVTAPIAPRWTLRRARARMTGELLQRHYEAASVGRRTMGWNRSSTDANSAAGPGLAKLRDAARDLVRNNPYAESALSTIVDHAVGWGIVPKPLPRSQEALDSWKRWAESTDCDADGRHDFAGLQKLVMRTIVESGEVLVRRRFRLPQDGLSIPIQLQILEPDFLDTSKDFLTLANGGRIIQGVEFDAIGRSVAYWLFREHPGSNLAGMPASTRVPADGVRHIFRSQRPGQVRAASWFAPVLLRFKDFDEFEDATLMKQKIAACLAVITSDVDGSAPALGTVDPSRPDIDSLEPGAIINAAPGRTIEVVQPPTVREYADYCATTLRSIASGIGVTYEDLTGNYETLSFSAARMSRIRHQVRVDDWRWRLLIPQFCDPVWQWVGQAAAIANTPGLRTQPTAEWTAPPMPMIEPDKEGLAYQRNIRSGIMTLSEAIRERGYDPDDMLGELAADFKKLDGLGLVLDSDPRKMTQAGQAQSLTPAAAAPIDAATASSRVLDFAYDVIRAEAARPIAIDAHIDRGAIQVTTPEVRVAGPQITFAKDSIHTETPVTIAPGAVRVDVPLLAESVHVAAGRKVIERDKDNRITAVRHEGIPANIHLVSDAKEPATRGA